MEGLGENDFDQNRIYIDSSVLCNWYTETNESTSGSDSRPTVAADFLNEVKEGKYEGVVSLIVIMEVVKFVRNAHVKKGIFDKEAWMKKEQEVVNNIYRLYGAKIVRGEPQERKKLAPEELTFGSISREAQKIMLGHPGKSDFNWAKNKPEHDGISAMDALHISLAKKMGCGSIAAFDKDFDETKDELKPLLLEYPKEEKIN